MKVYVHYEEGNDPELYVTLKLTLPRRWNDASPMKLLHLFIDAYNKRKPDHTLEANDFHLEVEAGQALTKGDTIGATMTDRADVHVRPGPTKEGSEAAATAAAANSAAIATSNRLLPTHPHELPAAEQKGALRCRNFGCNQHFDEEDNSDTACRFHKAPPIFHDTRKGWGCCEKRVYDWDEFEQIQGCQEGRHSTVDPKDRLPPKPPAAAQEAKPTQALKSINAFNAENPKAATVAGSAAAAIAAKKKCTRRPDGTASCVNLGCQKDFKVAENRADACRYHRLNPVFHDGGKHWGCCPDQVKYEFEDFIAVPGCSMGYHDDASGEFSNPPPAA
ncbi:unnamed protein product [Ascophyllum nodosum]